MVLKRIFNISNLTLLTALTLSGIAAWYSILGLMAIFAAAVIPIIVMGGSLEIAKVVTTVWLHRYWNKITWQLKLYLVPAVMVLALLTSMGIFGFLSKAHIDQGVPTGDVAAKVALIDEKIKTERDNIEVSRKALAQMDAQVNERLSRGTSEGGAERAVQIRKQQAKERATLQSDISKAQKEIAKLNEERVPIASQLRKVEAEVGPIKYIAALIYGDNPDANLLERAVRWVIILIVLVFDPLALTLVIASNTSRNWDAEQRLLEKESEKEIIEEPVKLEKPVETIVEEVPESKVEVVEEIKEIVETTIDQYPYLTKIPENRHPPGVEPVGPMVATIEKEETVESEVAIVEDNPIEEPVVEVVEEIKEEIKEETKEETVEVETKERPFKEMGDGYVTYDGKLYRKDALKELKPEFFMLTADSMNQPNSGFGANFPKYANKGDVFVRVDMLPNKVYKFDGRRWIEVIKENSDSYLHNKEYLEFLIGKIDSGEYDIEMLSEVERDQLENFLKSRNA